MEEKIFAIKFVMREGKIETHMSTKDITPQESIGLLEMAKAQILENIRKGTKEVFKSSIKGVKDE